MAYNNLTVTGTLTAATVSGSGTTTVQDLTVNNNAGVTGTLTAADVSVTDDLTVTDDATITGILTNVERINAKGPIERGTVVKTNANGGRPGIATSPYVTYAVVPDVLDRNGVSTAQQTGGAANLTITGALASGGVATFDVPRNVGIYCAGDINTVVFTVTGTDEYGVAMSEAITGVNAGTVEGDKAFKTVTQVATSAAVGTDVEVGTSDTLGFPVAILNKGQIANIVWNGAVEAYSTVTVGDTTTATTTTGDIRGTANVSSATDGTKKLYVHMFLEDTTTAATAYGITQA